MSVRLAPSVEGQQGFTVYHASEQLSRAQRAYMAPVGDKTPWRWRAYRGRRDRWGEAATWRGAAADAWAALLELRQS